MIKLKDILLENEATHPFIPHKIEGRLDKLIQAYRNNGSKGDLNLNGMNLTKFPDVLKYVDVGGGFSCANNQLTSLEGTPTSVRGSFYCGNNQLRSLKGAPKIVSGIFSCNDNQLRSLVGAPTSVGGSFDCRKNKLTSLKGAPISVGQDFRCERNHLTSLEGAPISVDRDFYCANNAVQFTEEQIRSVCDIKGRIFV